MTVRGGMGATGGPLIVAFIAFWSTTTLSAAIPRTPRDLAARLETSSFQQTTAEDQQECEECHGAPPASGAHTSHADRQGYDFGIDCNVCHHTKGSPELHDDGNVDVRLSPALPTIGAVSATFRSGTCSNVYCHSNARGEARAMTWDDGTDLGCDGCHDYSTSAEITMSGEHAFHLNSGVACADCHSAVVDMAGGIADFQRHVNGTVDLAVLAGDYDFNTASCQSGCHETRDWPAGPGGRR